MSLKYPGCCVLTIDNKIISFYCPWNLSTVVTLSGIFNKECHEHFLVMMSLISIFYPLYVVKIVICFGSYPLKTKYM